MNGNLLEHPEQLPLLDAGYVHDFGPTTIVAPHQDDESLGCGGLIALLRQANTEVSVLFMSDGSGSHPGSKRFPPTTLRDLREAEALAALFQLDVSPEHVDFLRLQDTGVPHAGDPGFADAVERCRNAFEGRPPRTVMVPWRRDPHGDHRATWQIITEAIAINPQPIRLIEYPVWAWDSADPDDAPRADEMRGWRLDISSVVDRKWDAITSHRSQTTDLIDDDPSGFRLEPDMLEHFRRPWELYLEPVDG